MAIEGITNVSVDGDRVLLIETSGQDLQAVKAKLKPFLQRHFEFVRLSSLVVA